VDEKTMSVHRRDVKTGDLSGADSIRINSGLKEGEVIAISGVSKLQEGQVVRKFDKVGWGEEQTPTHVKVLVFVGFRCRSTQPTGHLTNIYCDLTARDKQHEFAKYNTSVRIRCFTLRCDCRSNGGGCCAS